MKRTFRNDPLTFSSNDYPERMEDRLTFPTYLTTSPFTPSLEAVYCALLTKMNWSKLYVLHDLDGPPHYGYMASRLISVLPVACGARITSQVFHHADRQSRGALRSVLLDFTSRSRGKLIKIHIRKQPHDVLDFSSVMIYLGNAAGLRMVLVKYDFWVCIPISKIDTV